MKYFRIFLILLLFTFVCVKSCEDLIKQTPNEKNLILKIQQNLNEVIHNYKVCLDKLIRSSKYEAIEYLINELIKKGISFKDDLNQVINDFNLYLISLKKKYDFAVKDYEKAYPLVQWAQNNNFVFIQILLKEKLEDSECEKIEEENFDIQNTNTVSFYAFCNRSDRKIKFELDIPLYFEIRKLNSHWIPVSKGVIHVTLRKRATEYWEKLFRVNEPSDIVSRWPERESEWEKEQELKRLNGDELGFNDDDDWDEEDEEEEEEQPKEKPKRKKRGKKEFNPIMGNKLIDEINKQ